MKYGCSTRAAKSRRVSHSTRRSKASLRILAWRSRAENYASVLHGIVQAILVMLLEKAGWNTASEVRLKIVSDAEPVPDLIAVRGKFKGRYPTAAPALCIEILSPRDTLAKTLEKASTYISWGSQCVWIIDPEKRTAWNLSREVAGGPIWIAPNGTLSIGETAIELPTLFAVPRMSFGTGTSVALVKGAVS